MNLLLRRVQEHKFFLLFVFLFAYAQSVHIRIWIRDDINWYVFTPEAAIAIFISACILFAVMGYFIQHWQQSQAFNIREALKIFATSLAVYLLVMKLLELIAGLLFNTLALNFNGETILLSTFTDLMHGVVYGSFFLAYHYFKKHKSHLEQLASYNQMLSESKINQLKTQLNPHFLFNNLNILDQLIEEDKEKASDFLNEFAEIYRYVLKVSDQKLISLDEELGFAKSYFMLIKQKYGNAYLLEADISNIQGYIVPLTLQLLIENAVKHNLGTEESPVLIQIRLNEKLVVSNNTAQKRHAKPTSGIALKNLGKQYALLTRQSIEIHETDKLFCVSIPVITTQEL